MIDTIGSRLLSHRHRSSLSQDKLAKAAGLTKRCYQLIEHGKSADPRIKTLAKICAVLKITVGELTEGLM